MVIVVVVVVVAAAAVVVAIVGRAQGRLAAAARPPPPRHDLRRLVSVTQHRCVAGGPTEEVPALLGRRVAHGLLPVRAVAKALAECLRVAIAGFVVTRVITEVAAPVEALVPVSSLIAGAVRIAKGRVRRVCVRVKARVGVAGEVGHAVILAAAVGAAVDVLEAAFDARDV